MLRTLSNAHKSLTFVALLVAVLVAGCATAPAEQQIDNVPMYGQPDLPRPEALRKADEDFIARASADFHGNLEAASDAWWQQGEEFRAGRNPDYAMRRYNQAWLLNPGSYKPYWGFAQVMLARDKLDEAIKYFEKAKQLCDPLQRAALLADIGTAYSYKAESIGAEQLQDRTRYFGLANDSFRESTALDPNYSTAWRRWAMSLYAEGNYAEARVKVSKARSLLAPPFSDEFLKALEQKTP